MGHETGTLDSDSAGPQPIQVRHLYDVPRKGTAEIAQVVGHERGADQFLFASSSLGVPTPPRSVYSLSTN